MLKGPKHTAAALRNRTIGEGRLGRGDEEEEEMPLLAGRDQHNGGLVQGVHRRRKTSIDCTDFLNNTTVTVGRSPGQSD